MTLDEQIGFIVDRFEGGDTFTDDPRDPGQATKFGVTRATLEAYRREKTGDYRLIVTADDVRQLERGEALDVIQTAIVVPSGVVFILHDGLRFVVIDYALHSSPDTAVRALQQLAGVKVDGVFGPISQNAVNRHPNPVQLGAQLVARRGESMQRQIAHDPRLAGYRSGWFNRIVTNLRLLAA